MGKDGRLADFWLKAGDLVPSITSTLVDANGNPIDIHDADVTFVMRLMDSDGDAVLEEVATNAQNGDGTDGSMGDVRYDWQEGQTDIPGGYEAEWRVAFADGQGSMPNNKYVTVAIVSGLGHVARP